MGVNCGAGVTACLTDDPNAAKMLVANIVVRSILPGAQALLGDVSAPGKDATVVSDPRITNICHFNVPLNFDALPSGAFTIVRKLATGINGDIVEYEWSQDAGGEHVAVKKLRRHLLEGALVTEANDRSLHLDFLQRSSHVENSLSEIGILSYLAAQPDLPEYVLRMRRCFMDEHFVWLVTELAEGGELFNLVASKRLSEAQVRRYMYQLLQAVAYLHRHHIGHRDLSLENVLLKDNMVKVMDFGFAVLTHSASHTPLRYFRALGKPNYIAPECYVPQKRVASIIAPIASTPGDMTQVRIGNNLCEVRIPQNAVPGRFCQAEVWGYEVTPSDIFSSGICLFIMGFQFPAWPIAQLSDFYFAYVYNHGDEGLEKLLHEYKRPLLSDVLMRLLTRMLQPAPWQRPSAIECLADPWFADLVAGEATI